MIENRHGIADYWRLSRRLAAAALTGDPLHVYLSLVAGELLAFVDGTRVEIWCNDLRRPFRLVRGEDGEALAPSVAPLPTDATNAVERACLELISGTSGTPQHDQVRGMVLPQPGAESGECVVIPFAPRAHDGSDQWVAVFYGRPGIALSEDALASLEEVMRSLGTALTLRATNALLRERMKELTCLYGIALLKERPGMQLEEVLEGIVALLPPAWLYPDDARATLVLDGRTYGGQVQDEPERSTLSSDVIVRGVVKGVVTVGYAGAHPTLDRGPFLLEEEKLLDTVAREIALVVERRQAAEENVELERQLQRSERLATVGETAAGITHELNEPLNNILGFAQLLQTNSSVPTEAQRDVSLIVSSALHARQVVRQLLLFSSQFYQAKVQVELNELVRSTQSFLEVICGKAGVVLGTELAEGLPTIPASPDQLRQVLVNLVVNATQASREGGRITVSTSTLPDDDGSVVLVVEDDGDGMPDEVREKIFMPFFTTREGGTGMGLSVVHGIVTGHGGHIRVTSEPGAGSRFEITLSSTVQ